MIKVEDKESQTKYIFVHLGARAHYQFPEAVAQNIYRLYTDIWIPSNFITKLLSRLPFPTLRKILQRNNKAIDNSKVISFPFSLLINEILWKAKGINGWDKIISRNIWFQDKVKKHLQKNIPAHSIVLFTFAYTALEPLKLAKDNGWKTIMYQMDPGLKEEEIVQNELEISTFIKSSWKAAPSHYWDNWKKELSLTDKIIVNSSWSKSALLNVDVSEEKIIVMPLGLEENNEGRNFNRNYPEKFTNERPLKVLFLGILTLRKGLRPLLEAIEVLKDEPIEFTFVGTPETKIKESSKVKVIPSISRAETAYFYQKADLFLFPTLSDGFGLTQLEALSWKLPVISSRFCGDVIENTKNGIILKEVTKEEISKAILYCCQNPKELQKFSSQTQERLNNFSLHKLNQDLTTIF